MTTYYTNEHEWISVNGDVGTVGITKFAAEKLGDVVFVELPDAGKQVMTLRTAGDHGHHRTPTVHGVVARKSDDIAALAPVERAPGREDVDALRSLLDADRVALVVFIRRERLLGRPQ